MRFLKRDSSSKRPYSKISLKKRKMLVNDVLQQTLSISKAAKKHRIRLTTARLIIKKYKETGGFPMKKFKNSSRLVEDDSESSQQSAGTAGNIEVVNDQQIPVKIEHQPPEQLYCDPNQDFWAQNVYIYYVWSFPQTRIC